MKKLTIISSSSETPELLEFLSHAYLQSHLSVWENRKIIKCPSLVMQKLKNQQGKILLL